MPQFKALCAGVLFIMFVALYGLWPLLTAGGAEISPIAGEKRLSVAQFNIHGADADPDAVVASIRGLNPDVMTVVEIEERNRPIFEALKAQWPYQTFCPAAAACDVAIEAHQNPTLAIYPHVIEVGEIPSAEAGGAL